MGKKLFAGILIGLGSLGYLALGGLPGAILFSFGLISIVLLKAELFTGSAGVLDYTPIYLRINLKELGLILFGNIIGCLIIALISKGAPDKIIQSAKLIVTTKVSVNLFHTFLRAVMCGLIIDIAVYVFKYREDFGYFRILPILLGVPLFIVSGAEHSIADAYFIFLASEWSWRLLIYYPIVVLGNFVGCNIRRLFLIT